VNRFVVISGCSGGGKSTLLAELGRRGYTVIEEPGRRIVIEEMNKEGSALPWVAMAAFALRAIATALVDRSSAPASGGWIFFDRSFPSLLRELPDGYFDTPLPMMSPTIAPLSDENTMLTLKRASSEHFEKSIGTVTLA
jgi:nicotinamide riboside kinase